jgi:hypothetical protein
MKITQIDGLPVFDAKRPLVLHVTRSDIAKADRKEPNNCAIARACRRELHVVEARIHLGRTYLRLNAHNWTRYATPKAARDEIIAFDRGGSFEPGEILLAPVKHSQKLGTKRKTGPKTKPGKPRRSPQVVKNVRGGPA